VSTTRWNASSTHKTGEGKRKGEEGEEETNVSEQQCVELLNIYTIVN
jgi:hypothetical protein